MYKYIEFTSLKKNKQTEHKLSPKDFLYLKNRKNESKESAKVSREY